jgi:hypothetical protein
VLLYLFLRIEQRLDGSPTLILLDEAWAYLQHELFRDRLKDWLKTMRRKEANSSAQGFRRNGFPANRRFPFFEQAEDTGVLRNGVKSLLTFDPIATSTLDSISTAQVTGFISKRRKAKLKVSSINRELEVLRRILRLAFEWAILTSRAYGSKCFQARMSAIVYSQRRRSLDI